MKSIFRIFSILFVLALIQQGPALFALLNRLPVEFKKVSSTSVSADLRRLPAGKYYFSAGRVVNDTTAFLNGNPINTGTLTLGCPFQIDSPNQPQRLDIRWSTESWRSQLFDFPVVTSYGVGNLLQAWRTFNDVYMGSVSAILMLISVLVHARVSRNFARRLKPHILICVASLAYSFYMSGIPDLFWGLGVNTVTQILLRIALSASIIYLLGSYSRQNRFLLFAHILFAFTAGLTAIFYVDWLIPLYRVEIGFMGVFTFVAGIELAKAAVDRGARLLADFAVAWGLLHVLAILPIWGIGWGSYLTMWTPSFFAVLACLDFYLISTEAIELEAEAVSARRSVRIAGQVAHDIRSPLAALRTLVSRLEVSQEEKQFATLAFDRIDGIAKDVLTAYRDISSEAHQRHSLLPIIEASLREKRVEIEDGRQLILERRHEGELHAYVEPKQFKRILSNLLNNAIFATSDNDKILVRLQDRDRYVDVTIEDKGSGMTPERLATVKSHGAFDSRTGYGLGLSHAFSYVESWGGRLEIESAPGSGTTIVVKLKKG